MTPAAAPATVGATQPVPGDPRAMQRKLGSLSPGIFVVDWTTVSTVDGHRLGGSYRFGIGTAAPGEAIVEQTALASEGWLGVLGRWLAVTGLALWIGAGLLTRPA